MKYIRIWLKDVNRLDPGMQFPNITTPDGYFSSYIPTPVDTESVFNEDAIALLHQTLDKYFTPSSVEHIIQYIMEYKASNSKNTQCFEKLSLQEKFTLICKLEGGILSDLASTDDNDDDSYKEVSDDVNYDEFVEAHSMNDTLISNSSHELDDDLLMELANAGIGEIQTEPSLTGTRCQIIQALSELCPLSQYSITTSKFQVQLAYFIKVFI